MTLPPLGYVPSARALALIERLGWAGCAVPLKSRADRRAVRELMNQGLIVHAFAIRESEMGTYAIQTARLTHRGARYAIVLAGLISALRKRGVKFRHE